jgi:hypothetical protein
MSVLGMASIVHVDAPPPNYRKHLHRCQDMTFTFLNFFPFAACMAVLVLVALKSRRAKTAQNKVIEELGSQGLNLWFRVRLARPAYFRKRIKLMGFESSAVLVDAHDHVRVLGEWANGERLDRVYPKDALRLNWIGNPGLSSANMHWLSIGSDEDALMISADTGFNAVQSREATADICRKIDPGFRLPGVAKADFALEKNKASRILLVLFFSLLTFALVDGILLNTNELIDLESAYCLAIPALFLCAIPTYYLLVRSRVPSRESLVLALLLVTALLVAFIPALKRIDESLSDGPRPHAYQLEKNGRLQPLEPGLPALNFSHIPEYWAQFEPQSVHHFQLIRGPLGLWQLERRELNETIKRFYDARE